MLKIWSMVSLDTGLRGSVSHSARYASCHVPEQYPGSFQGRLPREAGCCGASTFCRSSWEDEARPWGEIGLTFMTIEKTTAGG